MALRIDQLLTPNHGAFDLINVKSPICPGFWGAGGGGGGGRGGTDRCISVSKTISLVYPVAGFAVSIVSKISRSI